MKVRRALSFHGPGAKFVPELRSTPGDWPGSGTERPSCVRHGIFRVTGRGQHNPDSMPTRVWLNPVQ